MRIKTKYRMKIISMLIIINAMLMLSSCVSPTQNIIEGKWLILQDSIIYKGVSLFSCYNGWKINFRGDNKVDFPLPCSSCCDGIENYVGNDGDWSFREVNGGLYLNIKSNNLIFNGVYKVTFKFYENDKILIGFFENETTKIWMQKDMLFFWEYKEDIKKVLEEFPMK